jgi:hypothetical protein
MLILPRSICSNKNSINPGTFYTNLEERKLCFSFHFENVGAG